MTSVFSWQNSISLYSALFHIPKPNLPVSPRQIYFLTSYFCILVPYDEKDIFLGCQFWNVLQVFIEPFNFSPFGITGWGVDLDYHGIEWFALEMNRDHSVVFDIGPKNCIADSFVDYEGYSISSKGFLPIIVDLMVI